MNRLSVDDKQRRNQIAASMNTNEHITYTIALERENERLRTELELWNNAKTVWDGCVDAHYKEHLSKHRDASINGTFTQEEWDRYSDIPSRTPEEK